MEQGHPIQSNQFHSLSHREYYHHQQQHQRHHYQRPPRQHLQPVDSEMTDSHRHQPLNAADPSPAHHSNTTNSATASAAVGNQNISVVPTASSTDSAMEGVVSAAPTAPGSHPAGPSAEIPVGTSVYVGNLSWDTRWQGLKDHMRRAGDVVHAEVFTEASGRSAGCGIVEYASVDAAASAIATLNDTMLDGRHIFVRVDREQGKHRHHASSRQSHAAAARHTPSDYHRPHFQNQQQHHHHYRGNNVDSHSENPGPVAHNGDYTHGSTRHGRPSDRGRKIVVWNLPYHIRWQDLKDLFREFGPVIRADVQQTYDGKSKGMGTVLFETEADAQRAIEEMTGKEIDGRVIDCRLDRYAQ